MRKFRIGSEIVYIVAAILLALATSLLTTANFGLSMVVAPAYIVSLKVPLLTFGQAEYVVQGLLFIALCLILRKFKLLYLFSFIGGFIYGTILDLWRTFVPWLNPEVYAPGAFPMKIRILLFVVGFLINSFSVMLYFQVYLYPQVYEFFVKGISERFGIELSLVKRCFDMSCLAIAIVVSLVAFHKFVGIGVGTVLLAFGNGLLIKFCGKWYNKHIETVPIFPKLAAKF